MRLGTDANANANSDTHSNSDANSDTHANSSSCCAKQSKRDGRFYKSDQLDLDR
jgi:hypothetical protein